MGLHELCLRLRRDPPVMYETDVSSGRLSEDSLVLSSCLDRAAFHAVYVKQCETTTDEKI